TTALAPRYISGFTDQDCRFADLSPVKNLLPQFSACNRRFLAVLWITSCGSPLLP
ncbi:hypothetical protein HAX54_008197, partial [Datura stramonium]|nr:hypothetical protein [Datura stramonium]